MRYLFFIITFHLFVFSYAFNNSPIGARSTSIGDASLCIVDVWSVFNNQAGLSKIKKISTGFSYENKFLINNLSSKSFVFALPTKSGVFGICTNYFGYDLYNELKTGLAYGKSFGDIFSIGVQIDYLHTHIGETYGNKGILTCEAGIQAKLTKELFIGVHIFNPIRAKLANYFDERVSTIMKLGLLYKISEKVQFAVETEKDIKLKQIFKFGLEYHLIKQIFIRTGMQTNPTQNSFGFGFDFKNFKIDVGSKIDYTLGYSSTLSLFYDIK